MATIGSGNLSFLWNCVKKLIQDVTVTVQSEVDLSEYQKKLTFDDAPTADSENPVTSGGVKASLDELGAMSYKGEVAYANLPTSGMKNGDAYKITDKFNNGTYTYPAGILAVYNNSAWVFFATPLDDEPTEDSDNMITSGSVYTAIQQGVTSNVTLSFN